MAKKILILNGSPQPKGNTAALVSEFANGAEEAGHDVTRINLQGMDIHHCLGCLKGGKDKDSPCVQKDDMDKIYPAFREADVIVLASPMYYWSFTGLLKNALDRTFAIVEAGGFDKTRPKSMALLMAAEDASAENFEPILALYRNLTNYLKWQDLGKVLAGGVYRVGDIEGKPALDEARKLGASIK